MAERAGKQAPETHKAVPWSQFGSLKTGQVNCLCRFYGQPYDDRSGGLTTRRKELFNWLEKDALGNALVDVVAWRATKRMKAKVEKGVWERVLAEEKARAAAASPPAASPGKARKPGGGGSPATPLSVCAPAGPVPGGSGTRSGGRGQAGQAPVADTAGTRYVPEVEGAGGQTGGCEGSDGSEEEMADGAADGGVGEGGDGGHGSGHGSGDAGQPMEAVIDGSGGFQTPREQRGKRLKRKDRTPILFSPQARGESLAEKSAISALQQTVAGADAAPNWGAAVRALAPALGQIGAALRAVLEALEADRSAGLADSAVARVEGSVGGALNAAETLAAAFAAGHLRGEADALERHRRDLADVKAQVAEATRAQAGWAQAAMAQSAKAAGAAAPPPPGTPGHRRSWRDVAAGGPRAPLGVARRRVWDPARTLFWAPSDQRAITKPIESFEFGKALCTALGADGGGSVTPLTNLVRTGAGHFKAELTPQAYALATRLQAVTLPKFGEWTARPMHPSAAPSLVVSGIDTSLSDEEVAGGLIAGSKEFLEENERGKLGTLRVKRLFLGASDNGSRQGEGGSRDHASRPTRSVRVYGDPAMLGKFEELGQMKLFWSLVPCRQYIPRQFYCKICKRQGNHSTACHRVSFREQERRDARGTGRSPRP